MKICVLGLWHLGSVTSACLAHLGHEVVGVDQDREVVARLNAAVAPVLEPELEALLHQGLASGTLSFSSDVREATAGAQILWMAWDTPLDQNAEPQPELLMQRLEAALPWLDPRTQVVVSSQLPVGSMRTLHERARTLRGGADLCWAYLPENLRLGSAVNDFLHPHRILVGTAPGSDHGSLAQLLAPLGAPVEWMSVESAEMSKHALNAFLALSVTFANEIASLCERAGADAKEVERGLRSDPRVGPKAYIAPGAAFAGGTLGREITFLNELARVHGVSTPVLSAIGPSNAAHRRWAQDALHRLFPHLPGTTFAVWGLTYKAGTDTLRDSPAVDLCDWMVLQGATVRVHDPVVRSLPQHWQATVTRVARPLEAVAGAHALVMATAWPIYREIAAEQLLAATDRLVVLDAVRLRPDLAALDERLSYVAVGSAVERV